MSTPMRRTRSPCCARAASGHAAAPPRSVPELRKREQTITPDRRPAHQNFESRNVSRLADAEVQAVVREAHALDPAFGLYEAWNLPMLTQVTDTITLEAMATR